MKKIFCILFLLTTLSFGAEKRRAISTAQFTTEILLSLGVEDQMIGTAYLDDEILPELKDKYEKVPVLSKKAPTKEQFYSLEPDFLTGWKSIINSKNLGPEEELRKNGIEVYILKSQNSNKIEDIYYDIRELGKKFGVEKNSEDLINKINTEILEAKKNYTGKEIKVLVYDSQEKVPFVAGGGGIGNTIIELAGGKNIFSDTTFSFGNGSWERIIDENPDYIIILNYGETTIKNKLKFLEEKSPIKNIDAIKNNRIIVMNLSDFSPGVRVGHTIKELSKRIGVNNEK